MNEIPVSKLHCKISMYSGIIPCLQNNYRINARQVHCELKALQNSSDRSILPLEFLNAGKKHCWEPIEEIPEYQQEHTPNGKQLLPCHEALSDK